MADRMSDGKALVVGVLEPVLVLLLMAVLAFLVQLSGEQDEMGKSRAAWTGLSIARGVSLTNGRAMS